MKVLIACEESQEVCKGFPGKSQKQNRARHCKGHVRTVGVSK